MQSFVLAVMFRSALLVLAMFSGANAFSVGSTPTHAMAIRPTRAGSGPIASVPTEMMTGLNTASLQLASVIPGGVGYGGKDSFWENAGSGAGGDLSLIAFLTVVFPIAVTAFFFIEPKGEE